MGIAGVALTWDGRLRFQPYGAVQGDGAVGGRQGQQLRAKGIGSPVELLCDARGLGETEESGCPEPRSRRVLGGAG